MNKKNNDPYNLMPREKAVKYGVTSLTDVELLAAIIHTGVSGIGVLDLSESILKKAGSNGIGDLANLSFEDLSKIKGIGMAKAIQIRCIIELSKRFAKSRAFKKINFKKADLVASYYMEDLRHLKQEHLKLVLLDSKCNFIKDLTLTIGTFNSSLISVRDVFINALRSDAVMIILVHNHPSGDPTPSSADIKVTREVYEAGKLIGINLVDHIIIGDKLYVSLREKGLF
jgi:DNA repair protein RadC